MRIPSYFFALLLLANAAMTAPAAALDPPTTPALLTLTGELALTNEADRLVLDRETLESFPHTVVQTETPWTNGMVTFEGVSLKFLLGLAGAKGTNIHAIALNDYAVDIPISDAEDTDVIVAFAMNGAPMSVREKGPLWIIYPLSRNPSMQNDKTHSKMIWQLSRLEIGQ